MVKVEKLAELISETVVHCRQFCFWLDHAQIKMINFQKIVDLFHNLITNINW